MMTDTDQLFEAIHKGNVESFYILMSTGKEAKINARDSEGNTLLHAAIFKESEYILSNEMKLLNDFTPQVIPFSKSGSKFSPDDDPKTRDKVNQSKQKQVFNKPSQSRKTRFSNSHLPEDTIINGSALDFSHKHGNKKSPVRSKLNIIRKPAKKVQTPQRQKTPSDNDSLANQLREFESVLESVVERVKSSVSSLIKIHTLIKYLLERKIDVNLKNKKGQTALQICLKNYLGVMPEKTIATAKMLIDAGANVNDKNEMNYTALHEASRTGEVNFVKLLICLGADVNARNSINQWTPLHWAAYNVNFQDLTIFEILLSANADCNSRGSGGETPLHVLLKSKPVVPPSFGNILELFLKHGANLNLLTRKNYSVMDIAIDSSNTEAVKALVLTTGIDVNSLFIKKTGGQKKTLLHGACENFDLPTVKFLLKNGADVNALDKHKLSPLQCLLDSINGTSENLEEKVKLLFYLLKFNPDLNTITISGRNILTKHGSKNELSVFLWKILIRRLAILYAVNKSSIRSNLFYTICKKPEYYCYFKMCNKELKMAKNVQLREDINITLFDLLIHDKAALAPELQDKNLEETEIEIFIASHFLIYGILLTLNFFKVLKTRLTLDLKRKN